MTEQEAQGEAIVGRYVMWSVGSGFIPFPLVDLAAVSGIQLRMLSKEAELYGVPFSGARAKGLVAALLGSVVPSTLAYGSIGSIFKAIPLVGTLAGVATLPAFYGASTYALGKVFLRHFASGGNLLDFDPEQSKAYFKEKLEEGKQIVTRDRSKGIDKATPATT
ncbi:MAG: hypothetical protein QOJ16_4451 [Acidobacteriota bacterium]|jgi:uncharacterized protein (DUF697 family)|nr:hypothetical protein [Acidobacteriota bacterium]